MPRPGAEVAVAGRIAAPERGGAEMTREAVEELLVEEATPKTVRLKLEADGPRKPQTLKVPTGTRRVFLEPSDWLPDELPEPDPSLPDYQAWNIIDGIQLAGTSDGYDLTLERWFPRDGPWVPEGDFGLPMWEVPPSVAETETGSVLDDWWVLSQFHIAFWPHSDAPARSQIRTVHGVNFEYQPAEIGSSLCMRLVYEHGFWRSQARMFG